MAKSREKMQQLLIDFITKQHPRNANAFMKTTEEFSPDMPGGIWMCGECNDVVSKTELPMFEYYAGSWHGPEGKLYDSYIWGVHPKINKFVESHGWWFEWYDPGTIMLWPQ